MPGVRHAAIDPTLHGLRVDTEARRNVDRVDSCAVQRTSKWVVHATTPIAGENAILAKESQDVLTLWFTFRHIS
ncbi:hypothetical protein KRMM14A1004_40040 [Krasilnikovia sp. MM14-A1004]